MKKTSMNNIREPQFAGKFYPSGWNETKSLIEYIEQKELNNLKHIPTSEIDIIGGIVPHAGTIYCGYQAIHFFHYLKLTNPDTLIIISPSHTGVGPKYSIDSHTHWKIPNKTFTTDANLINSGLFEKSENSQQNEHAAEVMLPYLAYYCPKIKNIAVITIREQNKETANEIAKKLHEYQTNSGKRIILIASSDFNHFEAPETGKQKDDKAIDAIVEKNTLLLEQTIIENNISICGYGPIMTLIDYANITSSNSRFAILRRGHSGEISPSNTVVDYVSMLCLTSNKITCHD